MYVILLSIGALLPEPVSAADAPSPDEAIHKAAAALYEDIRAYTLPNGLRVYLKPIAGAPVVTTMVAYKVGSADENLDATGLSHYLEHLMFKGTEKIFPGDIDRVTLRNGGANNAYTGEDYTVFHFDFAADRWQHALNIEADRMQNLHRCAARVRQGKKRLSFPNWRAMKTALGPRTKAILPLLFGKTMPYGHPSSASALMSEAPRKGSSRATTTAGMRRTMLRSLFAAGSTPIRR